MQPVTAYKIASDMSRGLTVVDEVVRPSVVVSFSAALDILAWLQRI